MNRLVLRSLISLSVFSLGGCDSLIAAKCVDGYVFQDGTCMERMSIVIPPDDGGTDGGPGNDGGTDGGDSDECLLGEQLCQSSCVRTDIDPVHCGGCISPVPPGQFCLGSRPVSSCDPPFTTCGDVCVDISKDPDYCGGCTNRVCASRICESARCVAARDGHVVVIGHNVVVANDDIDRIIGNAAFLSSNTGVLSIASYSANADPATFAMVDEAIDARATELSRVWERKDLRLNEVELGLLDADVFILFHQVGLSGPAFLELGTLWSNAFKNFVEAGRVLIVIDGPGDGGATCSVLNPSGLMSCGLKGVTTGMQHDVVASEDPIAQGVTNPYVGTQDSVSIAVDSGTVVVEADDDAVVVVHKIFR